MPRVFTIFNHGTGGSSLKPPKGEIVNIFGNNMLGKSAHWRIGHGLLYTGDADYMITEGVASIGDPHRRIIKDFDDPAVEHKGLPRIRKVDRVYAEMMGTGVEENVRSVITVLLHLERNGQAPQEINMIGWSRGAVTCIRIAWHLKHSYFSPVLSHVPVNIFAVDPVAGPGHNDEPDATEIYENVKTYVATLALDERRRPFRPIVPPRLKFKSIQTKRVVLRLPGIHRDTAKNDNSAGKVTFNLCARFLKKHGTELPLWLMNKYKLSKRGVLAEYIKLVRGRDASHVTPPNPSGPGPLLNSKRADQLPHSGLFVNVHHAAVFQRLLPDTFKDYLIGTRGTRTYWQGEITSENRQRHRHIDAQLIDGLAEMLELFRKTPNEPIWTNLTEDMAALKASDLIG